jgi:hypothetical protein
MSAKTLDSGKLLFDAGNYPTSNENYTPDYAVKPILKYIPKNAVVWCPFDEEHSEYVKLIRENGNKVICSHINTGQDFFEYEPEEKWDVIISNPPFCFDGETDVLTKEGWVNIKNITKESEPLTVNPKNLKLKYSKIKEITKQYYEGDMYKLDNKYIDLLITPNHRMVCYNQNNELILDKNTNDLPHIKDVIKKGVKYIPLVGFEIEDYYDIDEIKIPEMSFEINKINNKKSIKKYEEIKIKMEDWLAFFGIWLADGYVSGSKGGKNKYCVGIKQNIKNHEIISNILNNLGLKWKYYKNKNKTVNYDIYSMQFNKYMSKFGNSYEKYIPREILNLPKKKLDILLKWYVFGDCANFKKNGGWLSTVSKQLASDLSELALKTGKILSIRKKEMKYKNEKYTIYSGNLIKDDSENKRTKLKKEISKKINFNGFVYGLEVEENKTLIVRRNGKITITGNSNKRKFFERALSLGKPFALLMTLAWLNDRYSKQVYINEGAQMQLLMFDKRIKFNNNEGRPNDKITFSSGYYCRNFLPNNLILEELEVQ